MKQSASEGGGGGGGSGGGGSGLKSGQPSSGQALEVGVQLSPWQLRMEFSGAVAAAAARDAAAAAPRDDGRVGGGLPIMMVRRLAVLNSELLKFDRSFLTHRLLRCTDERNERKYFQRVSNP